MSDASLCHKHKRATKRFREGLSCGLAAVLACAIAGPSDAQSGNQDPLFAPARDGGYRYLTAIDADVQMVAGPAMGAEPVGVLEKGSVLLNLGCAPHDSVIWCEADPINGQDPGFVQAAQIAPMTGADGTIPAGPNDSKRRARAKDFDESGTIKCAQNEGESLGKCQIDIARAGGGDATVIVTFGNSFTRELYFTLGNFTRANTTMSGVGRDIDWHRQGDTYVLRVDDQRFEIPANYILGEPRT